MDNFDCENEGDLVMAAQFITPEWENFMARNACGYICLTLTKTQCEKLKLKPMTQNNRSLHHTAFMVTIEAAKNVTTGISAVDRSHTMRLACQPDAKAEDFISPGHINPLQAKEGGILERDGHTEGSIDLMKLAGLIPAAVIVEIRNENGTMARLDDLKVFAKKHSLCIITIQQLKERLLQKSIGNNFSSKNQISYNKLQLISESKLPTEYSENSVIKIFSRENSNARAFCTYFPKRKTTNSYR